MTFKEIPPESRRKGLKATESHLLASERYLQKVPQTI